LGLANGRQREFQAVQAYVESVRTSHNARKLGALPLSLLVVSFSEQCKSNSIVGALPP